MRMLGVFLSVLITFISLHSHAAEPGTGPLDCEATILAQPLQALVSRIIKSELSTQVTYKVQVLGNAEAQADLKLAIRDLDVTGYSVKVKVEEVGSLDGNTAIGFTIQGMGRDVAQGLIELSNPSVGRGLAPHPARWLMSRSERVSETLVQVAGPLDVDILSMPLRDLVVTQRTQNFFKNERLYFIGDLVQLTDEKVMRSPGVGHASLQEIKEALSALGLTLRMTIPGWPTEDIDRVQVTLAGSYPSVIRLEDWFDRSARKNSELFLPGHRGISLARPIVPLLLDRGRELAFVNYSYFMSTTAAQIVKDLWVETTDSARQEKEKIKNLQNRFRDFETLKIDAISGAVGALKLREIFETKTPVVISATGQSTDSSDAKFIVIPLNL